MTKNGERKKLYLRYGAYLIRWQLSTPVLAVVIGFTTKKMGLGFWSGAAIANLICGLIFFWVDRLIFRQRRIRQSGEIDLTGYKREAA